MYSTGVKWITETEHDSGKERASEEESLALTDKRNKEISWKWVIPFLSMFSLITLCRTVFLSSYSTQYLSLFDRYLFLKIIDLWEEMSILEASKTCVVYSFTFTFLLLLLERQKSLREMFKKMDDGVKSSVIVMALFMIFFLSHHLSFFIKNFVV